MIRIEKQCQIRQNKLNRFYIQHYLKPYLAWSGCRWVPHFHGMPTRVQIRNFATQEEAIKCATQQGLQVE